MASANGATKYFISIASARKAFRALHELHIHRSFPGYLCLREVACRAETSSGLRPEFKQFFQRYLQVGNASDTHPYVLPFNENGAQANSVWLNQNVAGSYAPSSIRSESPMRRVADIFSRADGGTYSLKEEHCKNALKYMLLDTPMPVLPLAVFLYRDYSLTLERDEPAPTAERLLHIFRGDFGFRIERPEEQADFATLFTLPHDAEVRDLIFEAA